MEEDSITITYETLYEILRAEKNKEELCELDEIFYYNVINYIKEKTKIIQEASHKNDIFSIDEKDNTQVQLQNIKKIIKEIYERREKKIINMALNKSRTNSDIIDTSNLLDSEKKFFEQTCKIFDNFRTGILAKVLSLKEPELNTEAILNLDESHSSIPENTSITTPELKNDKKTTDLNESDEKTELDDLPKKTITDEQNKKEISSEEQTKKIQKIKIIQATEQFIGEELETYGPYKEEEIAEVPSEIAGILIEQGKAEIEE
ncbi:hypothetical protein KY314_03625 [Candidatus Woesearchaeota archaeon]|nr:hypothetical protein [Candidatus Woesearchaeota archaeon]